MQLKSIGSVGSQTQRFGECRGRWERGTGYHKLQQKMHMLEGTLERNKYEGKQNMAFTHSRPLGNIAASFASRHPVLSSRPGSQTVVNNFTLVIPRPRPINVESLQSLTRSLEDMDARYSTWMGGVGMYREGMRGNLQQKLREGTPRRCLYHYHHFHAGCRVVQIYARWLACAW